MPLVQYLHTGGTIQYPHTHAGPAELAIITRCGRTVTLARGGRGSLLVFQSTHSATTIGAVVPASIIKCILVLAQTNKKLKY